MSGQGRYRSLWTHFYKDVDGIIFVIDSADTARMCTARDELAFMLKNPLIARRSIPLLVYCNKVDLHEALSSSEIGELMQFDGIVNRDWQIV